MEGRAFYRSRRCPGGHCQGGIRSPRVGKNQGPLLDPSEWLFQHRPMVIRLRRTRSSLINTRIPVTHNDTCPFPSTFRSLTRWIVNGLSSMTASSSKFNLASTELAQTAISVRDQGSGRTCERESYSTEMLTVQLGGVRAARHKVIWSRASRPPRCMPHDAIHVQHSLHPFWQR
jgi:hypothetical protein